MKNACVPLGLRHFYIFHFRFTAVARRITGNR